MDLERHFGRGQAKTAKVIRTGRKGKETPETYLRKVGNRKIVGTVKNMWYGDCYALYFCGKCKLDVVESNYHDIEKLRYVNLSNRRYERIINITSAVKYRCFCLPKFISATLPLIAAALATA